MRKILLTLGFAACVSAVQAQTQPGQMGNGPAPPAFPSTAPQQQGSDVEMTSDGKCATVRPGDIVHFSLTIEGVDASRGVAANLLLRPRGAPAVRAGSLQVPDGLSMGGGGVGVRDTAAADVYHFLFRVPVDVVAATFRGVALNVVQADVAARSARDSDDVDVTHHVRDQVKSYCLVVYGNGGFKPEVTEFTPGGVTRPPH